MAFTGNYLCNSFKTGLLNGTVDFSSGTYKVALYTNAATLTNATSTYTATGEVVASGYTAGGAYVSPEVGGSDGVSFVTFTNPSWTGAFTARGALVYEVGGIAICVLDFGSDKTSSTTFLVQFPPATANSALIRIS